MICWFRSSHLFNVILKVKLIFLGIFCGDGFTDLDHQRGDDAEVGFAMDGFECDQRVFVSGLEGEERGDVAAFGAFENEGRALDVFEPALRGAELAIFGVAEVVGQDVGEMSKGITCQPE